MRKSLTYKILAAVMAAGSFGLYAASPAAAEVVVKNNILYANGTPIVIENGEEYGGNYTYIFGAGSGTSSVDISGGNVTINTDKTFSQIFGGYTDSGNVHDNHVTINSGVVSEVYGGIGESNDKDDTLTNNTVTINGGTVTNVYGASSDKASATNNKVYITDCINISGIVGGASQDNSADSNAVYINGGNVLSTVYGGSSYYGEAYNNTVNISGDAEVNVVYGGRSISGEAYNNTVNISGGSVTNNVFGGRSSNSNANYNTVNINGDAEVTLEIYGGFSTDSSADYNYVNITNGTVASVNGGFSFFGTANKNTVNISSGLIKDDVFGGHSNDGTADNNIVIISGGTILRSNESPYEVYGGLSLTGTANNNKIIISGSANIENAYLCGGASNSNTVTGNTLTIDGWKGNNGKGDCTVNSLNNFESINFNNLINLAKTTNFTVTDSVNNVGAVNINSIGAGDYRSGTSKNIKLTLDNNKLDPNKITIIGDYDPNKYYTSERVNADGLFVNKYSQINVEKDANNTNTIKISATVEKSALAGTFIDADGTVYKNTNRTPYNTNDDTTSLTIGNGFTAETDVVAGAYAAGSQTATDGIINISGTTTWEGTVYAGYSESGSVTNNIINVAAGTKQDISLNGGNQNASSNTLNIEGNGSTFNSIANFETINFNNIALNNDTALSLISANLNGTTLNVKSLAGGNNFKAGDTVTLIESESAIKGTADGITLANEIITAGVAQDLTVSAGQSGDNKIDLTITDVNLNSQTNLAAQTRAASAAFVNQGTDLISDSLDTISRDSSYGVKTFAAVHGNRSKYDVVDDIKINGWSTIVGVGNADKFDNGSEFSWGVFYENGSGNYRTYNEFNNEFFRGDGSLVYNGGGIAARYTNKNGVYTEGSLRAGMLKSDMDNALRDGAGNYYGYESESAYYGAHLGIGKIISLCESSDLDVYGKFFHTYTEGDSFKVANDEFEFDSINSDRLRVGARITSNKENKFSTYYGLAYEYEFNGDADMTAQGLRADTQSLQGSSVMAEVGFNYQPTPDSPWSFDLNMRGYTGERQGGSFNVQATYTF